MRTGNKSNIQRVTSSDQVLVQDMKYSCETQRTSFSFVVYLENNVNYERNIMFTCSTLWGTRWRSWLRH